MHYKLNEKNGYRYIDEGKGEALVLLHGLLGSLSNWEMIIDAFSSDYRIIIPTLPIFDLPIISSGVNALTEYIHQFVTYLELNHFSILGNSLGGHVGLLYCINHPERVKTLILTGSSGLYENAVTTEFLHRKNYHFVKAKVEQVFYERVIVHWIDTPFIPRTLMMSMTNAINHRIAHVDIP